MMNLPSVAREAAAHRSNVVPIAVMVGLSGLLLVDWTRAAGIWLLEENHPIELLSFLAALVASIVSFSLLRLPHLLESSRPSILHPFRRASMFFLAMEEISWGQQFIGFSTPEGWPERNAKRNGV